MFVFDSFRSVYVRIIYYLLHADALQKRGKKSEETVKTDEWRGLFLYKCVCNANVFPRTMMKIYERQNFER